MDTLRGALECVDIATGELHRPEEALIEGVALRIESLGVGGVREACEVLAQSGAGSGAGAEERVAPARGAGRAGIPRLADTSPSSVRVKKLAKRSQ